MENLEYDSNVSSIEESINPCVTCLEGKQSRKQFKALKSVSNEILELIHADVCGPMEKHSLGGARFYVSFLDDFSKKVFVYTIKAKSDVPDVFVIFKNMVENQTGKKIKKIRSDCGTEFFNAKMNLESGIVHQNSAPYTPQQNGKSERMNRTIVEKARCLLLDAGLDKNYWAEAVNTAVYLINRTPCGKDNKYHQKKIGQMKSSICHTFVCLVVWQWF